MNVLHLLSTCDIGGVEVLCRDYALYSTHHNYFVAIWGTNGIVAKEMAENGANVVELGARKQDAIYIVKQLKAICKKHQIDVVIAHHGSPYFYFFYFWLKHSFCNLKLIAYAHCNSVDMYKKKTFGGNFLRRKIISYGFRRADQVIAISESVKASLYSELNVPTNTIKTIYN
ncbi:MAG: glycosyltransferase, partial [Lachnospiraceae bacterium]|nr:glycosyltransferase [Lachnospiraceae bacterium]